MPSKKDQEIFEDIVERAIRISYEVRDLAHNRINEELSALIAKYTKIPTVGVNILIANITCPFTNELLCLAEKMNPLNTERPEEFNKFVETILEQQLKLFKMRGTIGQTIN